MDEFIPWDEWVACIEPYYPSGQRGRPPLGIEKMLRMYLLQCWFNLSDEGIEYSKAIYKGLPKNTHRLHVLFASANLLMCIRAGRPLPA